MLCCFSVSGNPRPWPAVHSRLPSFLGENINKIKETQCCKSGARALDKGVAGISLTLSCFLSLVWRWTGGKHGLIQTTQFTSSSSFSFSFSSFSGSLRLLESRFCNFLSIILPWVPAEQRLSMQPSGGFAGGEPSPSCWDWMWWRALELIGSLAKYQRCQTFQKHNRESKLSELFF